MDFHIDMFIHYTRNIIIHKYTRFYLKRLTSLPHACRASNNRAILAFARSVRSNASGADNKETADDDPAVKNENIVDKGR